MNKKKEKAVLLQYHDNTSILNLLFTLLGIFILNKNIDFDHSKIDI